jgi:hypothetical protein
MTPADRPFAGVVLRLGGGRVLLGPAGTLHIARALALAVRTARRDGIGLPAEVAQLVEAVDAEAAEAMSARGHADVRDTAVLSESPASELVSVEEAAVMLGVSTRQARRLVPLLGGRKVGRVWTIDRREVAAHALRDRERAS